MSAVILFHIIIESAFWIVCFVLPCQDLWWSQGAEDKTLQFQWQSNAAFLIKVQIFYSHRQGSLWMSELSVKFVLFGLVFDLLWSAPPLHYKALDIDGYRTHRQNVCLSVCISGIYGQTDRHSIRIILSRIDNSRLGCTFVIYYVPCTKRMKSTSNDSLHCLSVCIFNLLNYWTAFVGACAKICAANLILVNSAKNKCD